MEPKPTETRLAAVVHRKPGVVRRTLEMWGWLKRQEPEQVEVQIDYGDAGNPPKAQAQETQGRVIDYPTGYNLTQSRVKTGSGITQEQLRGLADNYDLVRVAIERRKDQVSKLRWDIVSKGGTGDADQTAIAKARILFQMPDGQRTFHTWWRQLLEDMFVIDMASVEPRKTAGGDVIALDAIDSGTINRIINDDGRTPRPPAAAFQQYLGGVPANDLTTEDICVDMRNPRTHKLYGFSPVEQILLLINIGLRREAHVLEYYTEGSAPDSLVTVPPEWSAKQIREMQEFWDSLLSGNTAERRRMRFIPGGANVINTKDQILKDAFDEWAVRIVCFAFGLPPNAFVNIVARATAETNREEAKDEGLIPLMVWMKSYMDKLLTFYLDMPQLEFVWVEDKAVDPLIRQQVDESRRRNGFASLDQILEEQGMPKVGSDKPMIETPQGILTIEQYNAGTFTPGGPAVVATVDDETLVTRKAGEKKKVKAKRNEALWEGRPKYAEFLAAFLEGEGKRIADVVMGQLPPERIELAEKKKGMSKREANKLAKRISDEIDMTGWAVLIGESTQVMENVTKKAAANVAAQFKIDDVGILDRTDKAAAKYARDRAAEMVGMQYNEAGNLVTNPNPKFSITDSTRKTLRKQITKALTEGQSPRELAKAIQTGEGFSKARAANIARTELSNATSESTTTAWENSGAVSGKIWTLSFDHQAGDFDECDLNAEAGVVGLRKNFPSGHARPPAHPSCKCDVSAVVKD